MIAIVLATIVGAMLTAFLVILEAAHPKLPYRAYERYAAVSAILTAIYVTVAGTTFGLGGIDGAFHLELRWLATITMATYWAWILFVPSRVWWATGWSGLKVCAVLVALLTVAVGGNLPMFK